MSDNNNEKNKELARNLQNQEIENKEIIDKALEMAHKVLERKEEKNVIKNEKENFVLNPYTLEIELGKERRYRKEWEQIDNDLCEIQTLMPELLNSTSTVDNGIVDIGYLRHNALLEYDDIKKLPKQLRYHRYQNIGLFSRIVNSDYLKWFQDKKVLDDDDYVILVNDLNDNEQGITFTQLAKLSGKSVIDILDIFKKSQGFILLEYTPVYKEMVMYDDFYVRLIPVVDEENKLKELQYQYLLKAKAIETFIKALDK